MTLAVVRLQTAITDVTEIGDHLAAEAGLDVAFRLLEKTDQSLEFLSIRPHAGHLVPSRARRLRGLRSWPISGFDSYRVYYRVLKHHIEVIRVLHGARNIQKILRQTP